MKLRPQQYIVISQTILGLSLLGCLLIIPHYFFSRNQGGVSNYGTDSRTQWLFVIGFGAAALGTALAAWTLRQSAGRQRVLEAALYVLGALYLAVLLSTFPYKLSPAYARLHVQAAIVLFAGMFIVAIWLRFVQANNKRVNLAYTLFALGIVVTICSTWGPIRLLFSGQILSGITFAYILTQGITTRQHTNN